ncbi:hypothetical protein V9T40_012689 [Parthenolecanium corni]|uniref:Uncharacterized protein n=1 Tax=Parthenolecanium corni TaxID=536013 RepID=A0AAN9T7P5_9HEMI
MRAGVSMCWGPTPGTFALATIQNTDPMQAEDTKHLAPAIFEFCDKELSIPQNRIDVLSFPSERFSDVGRKNRFIHLLMEELRRNKQLTHQIAPPPQS